MGNAMAEKIPNPQLAPGCFYFDSSNVLHCIGEDGTDRVHARPDPPGDRSTWLWLSTVPEGEPGKYLLAASPLPDVRLPSSAQVDFSKPVTLSHDDNGLHACGRPFRQARPAPRPLSRGLMLALVLWGFWLGLFVAGLLVPL